MRANSADKADIPAKELRRIGGELLDRGITIRIAASGYSMFPAVRPGDIIHISPLTEGAELQPGDIVAIKRSDDFVVHRYMATTEQDGKEVLLTRGDATLRYDPPAEWGHIAGIVTAIIRGKKRLEGPLRQSVIRYRTNRILVKIVMVLRG